MRYFGYDVADASTAFRCFFFTRIDHPEPSVPGQAARMCPDADAAAEPARGPRKTASAFHYWRPDARGEKAEMMFPMWATQGWLQPFRFVELPETSKSGLQKSLQQFVQRPQESDSC